MRELNRRYIGHQETFINYITVCTEQIAKLHATHLSLYARTVYDQTALANTTICDYLGPKLMIEDEL